MSSDFEDFISEAEDPGTLPEKRYGLVFTSINPCPLAWQLTRLIPVPPHDRADNNLLQGTITITQKYEACVKALKMLDDERRHLTTQLQEDELMMKKDPQMRLRTLWVIE